MGDELHSALRSADAVKPPSRSPLLGSHVLLRPVDAVADAEALYSVSHPPDGGPAIWTYLPMPVRGSGRDAPAARLG